MGILSHFPLGDNPGREALGRRTNVEPIPRAGALKSSATSLACTQFPQLNRAVHFGETRIVLCEDDVDLGRRAAEDVGATIRQVLSEQEELRIVLAAGESQNTFFQALTRHTDLEWNRIVCFNMDDFWDPRMERRFSCGYQTQTQLYDKVHPRAFHLVDASAPDPAVEARRFEALLSEAGRIDITCQGIGTSGHLALNEPGSTDFEEPRRVKVVDIAEQSKRQLMADPNFKALGYIPDKGITMTIPALLSARHIFTIVPLALKRPILTRVLKTEAPDPDLPASIIRTVLGRLYVDRDSCPRHLLS